MINSIEDYVDVLETLETDIDRYEYIIELGNSLAGVESTLLNKENYVAGCQSDVWLHHIKDNDNTLQFYAHSDSKLVRGLLFILTEAFSGYTPNEMLNFTTSAVQKIPLGAQLSMQRQIGMMSVFNKMKYTAKQYTASA
ncbi:SufE family protein [bacterium]|nr:SufE family protein [bacterium]|tara:strand:+ start:2237 stop:2653 length:417 start_codon:yes stop_codon:yes gene_type:complete